VALRADDAAVAAWANHVNNIRVVHHREPVTAVDRHDVPREVSTDHAHRTGWRLPGRGDESRYQQTS
jgi:hypothetical protein